MRILIIEDEKDILDAIDKYLKGEKYLVDTAEDYLSGSQQINDNDYDIAIIDVNLPDGNGLDLIPEIKDVNPKTGIIIVSAKSAVEDRIKGLEFGADDYIVKPFHLSELVARISALLRRRQFDAKNEVCFYDITVDLNSKTVKINHAELELTAKEYELLLFFITNKNRTVTKTSLSEHIWGNAIDVVDNYDILYAQIKNLRKKIKNKGSVCNIKTVYGIGYKLIENEATK